MPSFKEPNIDSRLDSPPSTLKALCNLIKPCLGNRPGLIARAANLE
jgi:hypothetical protein